MEPKSPVGRVRRDRHVQADAIEQTLIDSGLSAHLAGAIVTETVGHLLPFDSPRELRKLVRGELARRVPVQSTWAGVWRRIGFVGTGGSGRTPFPGRRRAPHARTGDPPRAGPDCLPRARAAQTSTRAC